MIRVLRNPFSRSIGAMFRKRLDDILVFAYRKPGQKTFHTWFCPPLRIVALDSTGAVVFDDVFTRGQMVRLPSSTLVVIEADPGTDLDIRQLWEYVK